MTNPQPDKNFRLAVDNIKEVLRQAILPSNLLSQVGMFNWSPYPSGSLPGSLKADVLEKLGAELSTARTAGLTADARLNRRPTDALSTQAIATAIQELLLQNASNNVGINRGDMDAFAIQTQFLLDLQRYVVSRLSSRLQRVVRASHRRALLASDTGPLSKLTKQVEERFASSGSRTK